MLDLLCICFCFFDIGFIYDTMIQIQIWGDFECPYSYLQTVALAKLKERYQDGVEIIWRAIELAPTIGTVPPTETYLSKLQQAAAEPIVQEEQLVLNAPSFLTYTWLAQESVCFANQYGKSLQLALAIFKSVFSQGSNISNEDEIISLAEQVGIEPMALREAFDNGVLTKQVIADEEEFKANGFQGVPAMLIGEKNFSPKSFMPVTGYTAVDELEKLIPKKSLAG
jgi:predicted DsbA family dithiol-disulfide isomerase